MNLQLVCVLLVSLVGVVRAMSPYMIEAMKAERVSGYGQYDAPSWEPSFIDESPPYRGKRISREGWRIECSSETGSYKCENAIDGTNITAWRSATKRCGHRVTVDLGNLYDVSAVVILPPIDTGVDGLITSHDIYTSEDGVSWSHVGGGMWPFTNRQRMSVFEPVSARYVLLDNGAHPEEQANWVGISELNVYATQYRIPQNPAKGVWGPTLDFPIVPVAGAQESSGEIALWSSWGSAEFHSTPGGKTAMAVWNPRTNEFSHRLVTNTHHDMFCPGISIDGTGKMVVTGGNDAAQTSLYDGQTDKWEKGPELLLERGYQSSTTLSDGRVFVIGGSWAGGSNIPKNGEIYDPYTRSWKMLPDAKVRPMLTDDEEGPWRADNHGWLFGWKNESIFQAGPSKAMNWYYVDDNGSYKPAGSRLHDDDSMSGNAVMFDAVNGKILTFGGQPDYDKSYATNNAHLITLGQPGEKPVVKPAGINGKMGYERTFHTSVVLPDGKVFIAGGKTFGIAFNEENVQLVPEVYDPEIDAFMEMQQNNVIRVYHTISILLPDGRVLNGGGGLCGNCSANHYDAQIFTPPYLLTETGELRTRPNITSELPQEARVGTSLTFDTDGVIKSASLVRISSATHTVNTDQRRVPLDLKRLASGKDFEYRVELPDDPGILIPGYWMLFVMDGLGVPSVAKTVMITTGKKQTVPPAEPLLEEDYIDPCEDGSFSSLASSPTLIQQMLRRLGLS